MDITTIINKVREQHHNTHRLSSGIKAKTRWKALKYVFKNHKKIKEYAFKFFIRVLVSINFKNNRCNNVG